MARNPKNYYFIMNRETRQYSRVVTTKHAANTALRIAGRDNHFIVTIPDEHLSSFSAAYLRQHGTFAHPKK